MVKYLGLDYLKLAVNRKQEFLNKALIAVQNILEVIDLYTHKGTSYDRKFLSEERSIGSCFEAAVPEIDIGKAVEKFDSDTEDEDLGYFNLEDFVPSLESDDYDINSNKNDTKCDAEGSSKHDKKSKNLFNEVHQKDNLHDDSSLKLEETLTEDVFVLLKSNLPSLKCLIGRLHQNQVKDPLSRKDASTCNLQTNDNLRLCTPITTKKNIADCLQEEFVRVAVATDDEMLLEEALSPFSSPKEEKTSDEVTLLKDLNEISHNDLETGEISFPAASSDINMCGEKLQKEKNAEINKEDNFLNMNKIGDTEDDFEQKALLDSPLIINKFTIDSDNLQIQSVLHTLPKLQVHESDTNGFLKPAEIDVIKGRIWQKEKYFSDVLSMRIAEPEIKVSLVSHISLQTVIQQQNLVKEDHIGDAELSLSWDPVGSTVGNIKEPCSTTEKIDLTVKENISSEVFQTNFEKCQYSDMHCEKDDVIELSNTNTIVKNNEEIQLESVENHQMMVSSIETVKEDASISKPESKSMDWKRPVDNNKIWSDIITVQLGGKFENIVSAIDEKICYLLSSLKTAGDDLQNQDSSSLNTDYTRFLLKQKEKQMTDSKDTEQIKESYRTTVCLHALCGARDILINYCLESAIAHLQAAEDKYKSYLTGGIEDIRQKLFQLSCNFQQNNIYHPKVIAACKEVEKCFQFRNNSEKKVLIVVKRKIPSFLKVLEKVICHCSLVKLKIQEESQNKNIVASLEECNCMIIPSNLLDKHFPWAMINLVIEYEYDKQATLLTICETQNIKLVSFKIKLSSSESSSQQEVNIQKTLSRCKELQQTTILGSSKLTSCGDILPLLETRYNLIVIERNYSMFDGTLYFPDIDIDEKACIVLHSLTDMADVNNLEPFVKKIISLSLKYTKCWILLLNLSKSGKSYPYAGRCVSNLFKLQASLGNYVSKHDSFETKVLTCCSAEDICSNIRKICDMERKYSEVWNKEEWTDGSWLHEHFTNEEKFLLSIPCLNSISCQVILKKMTLKDLMSCSKDNLVKTLPMFPQRIIEMLFSIIHSKQGLNSKLHRETLQSNQNQTLNRVSEEHNQNTIITIDEDSDDQYINNTECHYKEPLSANSKYFGNPENTLKPPVIRTQNRSDQENIGNLKSNIPIDARKNSVTYNLDIRGNHNSSHLQLEPVFKTKNRMQLNGSNEEESGTYEMHPYGFEGHRFGFPSGDQDTQGTEDSLSQSSVKLNEYQKAEIEGNEHWLKRFELEKSDCPDESILTNNRSHHQLFVAEPIDDYIDLTYARSNAERQRILSPETAELQYGRQNVIGRNKVKQTQNDQYGRSIVCPSIQPVTPSRRCALKHINTASNDEKNLNMYSQSDIPHSALSQNKGQRESSQSVKYNQNRHADTEERISITENCQDEISEKNSGTRNFTVDLTETTRKILKQAYQSPRFGVCQTRPLSQRISVGLAQPLRRETNTNPSIEEERRTKQSERMIPVSTQSNKDREYESSHRPIKSFSNPNFSLVRPNNQKRCKSEERLQRGIDQGLVDGSSVDVSYNSREIVRPIETLRNNDNNRTGRISRGEKGNSKFDCCVEPAEMNHQQKNINTNRHTPQNIDHSLRHAEVDNQWKNMKSGRQTPQNFDRFL
ncbi:unnamed protein product [Mytilus edulis]|uniref:Uncharacterized protein n=1 Tax=Mytilus edulis TaxID=6550 RepID=A0A8S3RKI1_MYTED|nr:unnamed protein product [Mytilus edulis]